MANTHEMVYILSEDYWGFDPATRDDALNFYTNVWTLPKTQYDTLSDEDQRRKLYRCALFYVVDKTDNHGFTPIAIQSQGNTVIVAATAAGGGINRRNYDSGAESEYETGSIIMRQADTKATTFDELQDMQTSSPGKFKIEEFIFDDESAIKTKVEELQEELGQINAAESYASEAPADVALDASEPLIANPTTAAIAGANLITDVQDTSLNLFAEEETMNFEFSNLPGLPVVANNFGESSALMSGNSVPQWYGADGELTAADKVAMKRSRNMQSKMRGINRRNARKAKKMGAEEVNPIQFEQVGGQDALGVGLPVIANDFGEDSAGGSGHGVPQMYGAESDTPFGSFVDQDGKVIMVISGPDTDGAIDWGLKHFGKQYKGVKFVKYEGMAAEGETDMTQLMTSNALGQAGVNYDHEIHYRADELAAEDFPGLAAANEQTMALSPALPGLPVVPNDFGQDSSLSGNGVPQWYGAESSGGPKNYIYNRDNELEERILELTREMEYAEESEDYVQERKLYEQIENLEEERKGLNKIHLDAEGRKRRYGKRQRFDHIKGNSRYLARNAKGEWISNVGVSGSIKADLRNNAKTEQPVGFRGLGDADVRQSEETMNFEFSNLPGLPVVPNDFGESSALMSGNSVPQWYGAEASPSVVDAAEPTEYIPYEFTDEMNTGEYISSDDFMTLLAETVDGMALRYKPPMYRSPLAMAGAGAILAVVGMKLLKK